MGTISNKCSSACFEDNPLHLLFQYLINSELNINIAVTISHPTLTNLLSNETKGSKSLWCKIKKPGLDFFVKWNTCWTWCMKSVFKICNKFCVMSLPKCKLFHHLVHLSEWYVIDSHWPIFILERINVATNFTSYILLCIARVLFSYAHDFLVWPL